MRRWATAIAALGIAVSVARAEEMPKIFLERKIFAETSEGKRKFYEVHTVAEGESLWRILESRSLLLPGYYAAMLREFRRANPEVADPGRLVPGQKIVIPSGAVSRVRQLVDSGKAVSHRVVRGDALLKILAARGVPAEERGRYLETIRELNETVRDVDRIYAGTTLLLPTAKYFEKEPAPGPELAAAAPPPEVPLTRDAPAQPGQEGEQAAKPEAQLVPPSEPPPEGSFRTAPGEAAVAEATPSPSTPVYRGLLSDLAAGLGEQWIDRGTLYLPLPAGGEVVLDLGDYPVVRLSTGESLLIDLRNGLPPDVRALVSETWKNYRVVPLGGIADPLEIVRRFLDAAGYHSAKDGKARPLEIGEQLSVAIPADFVVLKTPQSLLTGDVILIKEVPETPGADLSAVLRYAGRVGIRVLPFSVDRSAAEGFLVGIEAWREDPDRPGEAVPAGGLPAVDYALEFLGLSKTEGEKISIGGKGGTFQLTVQPERIFEAGGKRFVVDTGRMSPALRSIVRDSGYEVFGVGREDTGRSIFRRILAASGLPHEERTRFLLLGGENAGFEIRVTGTFLTAAEYLGGRKVRAAVLVPGRIHPATRELMREFDVEVVEW